MAGYNQQGGYPPQNNPQQPVGGNYPQGPYQGPPQGPAPYPQQYYGSGQGPNPYGMANPNLGQTPGLVTAGFVAALIPCTSMLGIILCAVGMGEAKRRGAGEGLAMAGIIVGVVWQVMGIGLWILSVAAETAGGL